MIEKNSILERFENKEEKILVANILDKASRYEQKGIVEVTQFLNLNEYKIISQILDHLKISYYTYVSNEYADKRVIFFVPDYINIDNNLLSEYICCIKARVTTINNIEKLKHKDFMGSIYNLGIKSENIGDIYMKGNKCYFLVLEKVKEYIMLNMTNVGKNKVELEEIGLDSKELTEFKVNIKDKERVVPSLRADVICGVIFNLSRKCVKEKIEKGDLFINDKLTYSNDETIKIGDIISFRKYGRIVIKEETSTKSGKILLKIGLFN